jgi:hypothetical protein
MFGRIFPKHVDNTYGGSSLAIWLLTLIVLLKLLMSYAALFDTREMIQTADSIPLDSLGPNGAAAVLTTTKLLGLDHLLLNLLGVAVLVRWRTLIPFTYLLLAIEQIGRKALALAYPIVRTGEAYLPVDPNLVLAAALLIGLALSLATPHRAERASSA